MIVASRTQLVGPARLRQPDPLFFGALCLAVDHRPSRVESAEDCAAQTSQEARASGVLLRTAAVSSFDNSADAIRIALADGAQLHVRLLVAADGAYSSIRERAGIANYADVVGHLQAGKVRPLVTLTPTRIAPLPDLQTVGEAGYKELEYMLWFGTAAPAKTPAPIVKQLTEWFSAARQAPEVTEKLAIQGLFPETECGADFTAMMRKEYDNYGRVIREAGIKGE